MLMRQDEVRYWIDGDDRIVSVNEAWDAFARANDSDALGGAFVIGESLWDFISDETTQALYADMLARARAGYPVRYRFRCDSPSLRRLLEMTVGREPSGLIVFRSQPISLQGREPQRLLSPTRPVSTSALIRLCGWCKRVAVDDDWLEVEEAVPRLGLFEQRLLPGLTHGICPPCVEAVRATLRRSGRAPTAGRLVRETA